MKILLIGGEGFQKNAVYVGFGFILKQLSQGAIYFFSSITSLFAG